MTEYVAEYRPSASVGWMNCTQFQPDNTPNKYADEGTMLHECTEAKLFGSALWNSGLDEEQEKAVEFCADVVESTPGSERYIETAWSLTPVTGEHKAKGTADAVVYDPKTRKLTVIDYKFGRHPVFAERNTQLLIYASAVIADLGIYDVQDIELAICQPRLNRVDRWTTDFDTIQWFGDQVTLAISRHGEGEATPGEAQCRYCKRAGQCEAQDNMIIANVVDDFAPIDDSLESKVKAVTDALPQASGEHLVRLFKVLPAITQWVKQVEAVLADRLQGGEQIPGAKLVEGRSGNRQWADPVSAEAFLIDLGADPNKIINRELVSPAQADKLLSKDERQALAAFVTRSPGKPTVALESDKRPAIQFFQSQE